MARELALWKQSAKGRSQQLWPVTGILGINVYIVSKVTAFEVPIQTFIFLYKIECFFAQTNTVMCRRAIIYLGSGIKIKTVRKTYFLNNTEERKELAMKVLVVLPP